MVLFSTSSPFKFVSNIFYLRNSWSCDFLSADQILTCFWILSDSGFLLLLLTVMSWRHTIDNVVSLHDLLNGSCSVSREEQWQQLSRRRPVSRRGRRWPRQRALAASATTCHICRCYYCASCRRRTSSTGSLCLWPIAVCALAVYVHNPPVGNLLLSHAFMPGLTHDDEDNKVSPMTTMTLMTSCYLFDTEWEYLVCSYICTKSTSSA